MWCQRSAVVVPLTLSSCCIRWAQGVGCGSRLPALFWLPLWKPRNVRENNIGLVCFKNIPNRNNSSYFQMFFFVCVKMGTICGSVTRNTIKQSFIEWKVSWIEYCIFLSSSFCHQGSVLHQDLLQELLPVPATSAVAWKHLHLPQHHLTTLWQISCQRWRSPQRAFSLLFLKPRHSQPLHSKVNWHVPEGLELWMFVSQGNLEF